MKKVLLYGLLLIGFINTVYAQQTPDADDFAITDETIADGTITDEVLQDYTTADDAIAADAITGFPITVDPNYYPTGYDKFGTFGKVALGFGNIFLGLGSFIAGEPLDGLKLILYYGLGGAAAVGGYFLWDIGIQLFTNMGPILILILPAIIPVGVLGLSVFGLVGGTYTVVRTLVDAFLYPFRLGSPPSGNKSIDRPYKNVNVAFVPLPNGNIATQLSYTIRL
jgi:hypothetical protein